MRHQEGTFSGVRLRLYRQSWIPESGGKAAMIIAHGFGEHSGRYPNVVQGLTEKGYSLHALDHRGHGRSPGQRGHVLSWSEYRDDLKAFSALIAEEQRGHPVFLYGHSMGALIALDYVLHHPEGLRGVMVSGAPMEPAGVASPHLVLLARILSRLVPRVSLSLGIDGSKLSRDPEVAKAYEEDPLVHSKASVRWGTESLATIPWVKAHCQEIKIPILVIHGEADPVSLASGSQRLFEALPPEDKTLRIYPGRHHEPHNDLDWRQVVDDMAEWMDRHL